MRPAIIADGGDIFRAFADQRLNQVIGKSRTAESAEHDSSAVSNIGHSRIQARMDFVCHATAYPTRAKPVLQRECRLPAKNLQFGASAGGLGSSNITSES